MVRLIMSGSGEGKTKQLIELMENAADQEVGCMVCIEPTRNMSFNLRHQTRMIDSSEFSVDSFETGDSSAASTQVIMIFPTFSSTTSTRWPTARMNGRPASS